MTKEKRIDICDEEGCHSEYIEVPDEEETE